MNDIVLSEQKITNMIYEIRGQQVMLDYDLAKLYKCVNGTKTINQSIKRNIDRFPEEFLFSINKRRIFKLEVPIWDFKFEWLWWSYNLKFQIETSSLNGYGRGMFSTFAKKNIWKKIK